MFKFRQGIFPAVCIFAAITFGVSNVVLALPEGEAVEHGQVSFQRPDASTLHVTASDQAVISWNSFNIASGETVQFFQPSLSAQAFNQILSGRESLIAGNLFANGSLFLINPAGIHFTQTAHVDVGSLVASTLSLKPEDFLAGQYTFAHTGEEAMRWIWNEGRVDAQGSVAMIAGAVRNEGNIICQLGNVELVSGRKATVSFDDQGLIRVVVDEGIASEVLDGLDQPVLDAIYNSGTIQAAGGRIQLTAKVASQIFDDVVNQEGIIEAAGIMEAEGEIIILGDQGIRNTGTLQAEQGEIVVEGDRSLQIGGQVQSGNTHVRLGGDWIPEGELSINNLNLEFFDSTRSSTVYGDNTFDTLTIKTPAKQMYFEAGKTQIVLDKIEIEGRKFELVELRSTDPGNMQWNLDAQGEVDISYVHIGDAHNLGEEVFKVLPSNNYGNNTGFDTDPVWDGSSGDGLWSTGANWDTGVIPGSSDTATFDNTSTSNSTVDASFGGTVSILNVASTYTGTITLQRSLTASTSITLSAGTLNTNGNNLVGGSLTINGGTFTGSAGTVDINGNVALSSGTLTAPSGAFTVSGNWNKTGGTFTSGANTVTLDGGNNQTLVTGGTDTGSDFNNLTVNKSAGTVTANTNGVDVDGTLAITGGSFAANGRTITTGALTVNGGTLSTDGGIVDINGTVTFSSGTFLASSTEYTISGDWNKTGGVFNAQTSNVVFDGAGTQTINSGGVTTNDDFNKITVSGGGTLQLVTNALDIDGTLTISSGTVDLNGQNLTLATLDNSGTLLLEGGETVSITTMDTNSGTVTYDGTGTYTQLAAGDNYYNLTFDSLPASGSWTMDAALDVNNNFTITDGTINAAGFNINVAGNWSNSDAFVSGSNTVTFDGAGAQSIVTGGTSASKDFNNFTVNKGGGTLTLTTNALDVDGTLSITGGTFDTNALAVTAAGLTVNGGTFTGSAGALDINGSVTISSGTLTAPSGNFTVSGDWTKTGGTFTSGNNTVTFDTASDHEVTSGGVDANSDFYNVTVADAGNFYLATNGLVVNNNLTISDTGGVVDLQGLALTVSGTFSNDGSLILIGSETVTLTNDTDSGLVRYYGTGTYTQLAAGDNYYNLTLNSTGSWTLDANLDINNNMTITNSTLAGSSRTITVAGNWANTGTFTAGTSTVTFDGAGASTISGNTSFYNVTSVTAGKTISFTAGSTQTVTNGLTLTGSSGNNIVLQSTASGTAWNLTMTGSTQNVSYVSVSDSNASGGNQIQATTNNTDNGRNTNWLFTNPPPAADPVETVLASESGVVIQTTTDTEQQEDFASVVANAQEEIVQLVMEMVNDKGSMQSTSVNETVRITVYDLHTGKEVMVSTRIVVSGGIVMVKELDPSTGKSTGRTVILTVL